MLHLPPMKPEDRPFIPIRPLPAGVDDPGRRRFLHLMAASLALAGAGCSGPPPEHILPYVKMPEGVLPGQPAFYATTLVRQGYGQGVLVESNLGRPTKVEGNPLHPASRGATDVFSQAALLQFWDPDRSQAPWQGGQLASWPEADATLLDWGAALARDGGAGLRILTGTMTSATWLDQWRSLGKRFPGARWHRYDPLHDDGALRAAELAFRRPVDMLLHLERARVVVSLDADFLGQGPAAVAHARDFAATRSDPARPTRLYALEVVPGLPGANADERLGLPPPRLEALVWRLAARLGVDGAESLAPDSGTAAWEEALAAALRAHRGESLLVAGPTLSPPTRALVHVLNQELGNLGRTVDLIAPVEFEPGSHGDSLAALCEDMREGRVDTLLILGGNPVYDAPGGLDFAAALAGVPRTVHAGLYRDETARRCAWHLPLAHDLERWGDARGFDGTVSLVQPLIRPLYGARSPREILAMLGAEERESDYDALRRVVGGRLPGRGENPEAAWQRCLQEGQVAGSASAPLRLPAAARPRPPDFGPRLLTAVFLPDAAVDDGAFANNAWLQELPRPLTKLTWDNAALLAPATARALGLENGDEVELSAAGHRVRAPVWVLPGQAEETVGIPLGYGRRDAGRVGNGVGFDGYRLRSGAGVTAPVGLKPTGGRHDFACTQAGDSMEGRPLARHATAAEAQAGKAGPHRKEPRDSLYPAYSYPDYAWAMAIDLNACIGCGACTIACQAENNIPVVGREEVMKGRQMHWIRVDRYRTEAGAVLFQPVPCMHCENAPCEAVCPVGATVHDSEGLNVQVYNRCIGTRYCSNNCPYKVRRFNFLQYADNDEESLKAGRNPEVTVRRRGVMEKCNYCLQRITRARLAAEKEGRSISDGEVVTACEAVCPTRAIVFGNLNDPASRVNRAKASPLDYALLEELNTRPRTTYRIRITNPDPALGGNGKGGGGGE
ncbi:MAG TPA: 4Fe-4S dicluster domain-containing protein [Rhodocyclaceae bacterium]|nr:4Fe-4S dicluster domain-containing protein [Rhodocyclaceae bacterium]